MEKNNHTPTQSTIYIDDSSMASGEHKRNQTSYSNESSMQPISRIHKKLIAQNSFTTITNGGRASNN